MQRRKFLCNHWPIFLLACLLLIVLFCTQRVADPRVQILHVQVSDDAGTRPISLWESPEGIHYLFLPSGCSLSEAVIRLDTTAAVTIDGKQIEDGQSLSDFELGRTYTMKARFGTYSLQILQSANVPALYLDTASGTMKAIHADKANSESVNVTLVNADGTLDYSGGNCAIRGRGNSTWVYEKRPYLLTFTETADLLGMGAANKWVLLANATDESNLRNKLVYDLAGQLDFIWSPRCEFVDLYLNGEYSGLYLLAERVEIGESRLDIGADPDSFLCKLDLTERFASLENPFMTELGRAVEITDPEDIPSQRKDSIQALVQQMENAILSGELEGILDIDSWARRLLLDEITENLDGDRASSYFFYTNGKFYAGPIWDYDHIWGTRDTNLNPEALLAESRFKAPDKTTPYNNALYENPAFYQRMTALYEAELLPLMTALAEGGIEDRGEAIAAASAMNSIRWRHMFDYWKRPKMSAADLADFLTRRLAFLNSVWLDGVEYYAVQVDIGADLNYLNFVVLPGETFTRLSEVEVPGVADPVWVDSVTGEIFREDQPITRDIHLNLVQDTTTVNPWKDSLLILGYSSLLLAGIAGSIWFDHRNRGPKRRRSP